MSASNDNSVKADLLQLSEPPPGSETSESENGFVVQSNQREIQNKALCSALTGCACCCCCFLYIVQPIASIFIRIIFSAAAAVECLMLLVIAGVHFSWLPEIGPASILCFQFFPIHLLLLLTLAAATATISALILKRCRVMLTLLLLAVIGTVGLIIPLQELAAVANSENMTINWSEAFRKPFLVTSSHDLGMLVQPQLVHYGSAPSTESSEDIPLMLNVWQLNDKNNNNARPSITAVIPSIPADDVEILTSRRRLPVILISNHGRGVGAAWPYALAGTSDCVVFDVDFRTNDLEVAAVDIQNAIDWVRRHAYLYHVDMSKLILLGNGAGGTLALLSGFVAAENAEKTAYYHWNSSVKPRAVIALYPIEHGAFSIAFQEEESRQKGSPNIINEAVSMLGGPESSPGPTNIFSQFIDVDPIMMKPLNSPSPSVVAEPPIGETKNPWLTFNDWKLATRPTSGSFFGLRADGVAILAPPPEPEKFKPFLSKKIDDVLLLSSTLSHFTREAPETLIIAGSNDNLTPGDVLNNFTALLSEHLLPHKVVMLPYMGQGFDLVPASPAGQIAFRVVWDFIRRVLDENPPLF